MRRRKRLWENLEAGDEFGDLTTVWMLDDEGLHQDEGNKGVVNSYDMSKIRQVGGDNFIN